MKQNQHNKSKETKYTKYLGNPKTTHKMPNHKRTDKKPKHKNFRSVHIYVHIIVHNRCA